MRKQYAHTVMHESAKCKRCGKPLKKRLVEQKSTNKPTLCYQDYRRARWAHQKVNQEL